MQQDAPDNIDINGRQFKIIRNPTYRPFWDRVELGHWEPQTFGILDRFLRRDKSFIDIGAWIGPTALYGARLAGKVYAIEPDVW